MAVTINYRHVYICDTEAERDLSWPIEALIYCKDTLKYYKQEFGSWTEVPYDEIFFTSPIPIEKLAFSGTPSEEKYLRSDGSWAEPGIAGGTRVLFDSWDFSTNIVASDPGSGTVKFDNATFAGTANIYVSDLSLNNNDFSVVIGNLDTGDTIYMQEKDNAANAIRFQISSTPTDNTGWWTIPVTVTASVGSIWSNNQDVMVVFSFGGGGGGGGHTIQDEGTPLTQRTNLNFTGSLVSATDDSGNDATDVDVSLTSANFGDFVVALTGKTTPIDADTLPISDSAASDDAKKLTWANVKATLKTYFDTLYQAVGTYLTPANIDNTAYNATSWDGVTTIAPSKNAVRDRFEAISAMYVEYMFTSSLLVIDQDMWPFTGTVSKIVKLPGVATISYTKNGGASTPLVFNATTITTNDSTSTPIAVNANDIFVWTITYTGGYTSASFTAYYTRS